jgi:hypothetical protein
MSADPRCVNVLGPPPKRTTGTSFIQILVQSLNPGYGPDRDRIVTSKSSLTARGQLARTAAHWGWEVIGDPNYTFESRYRRAPFTLSAIFSEADSVVYATLSLDPPIGTQGLQSRCIAVIDEGYNKHHRVEVWMMQHGHSATKRGDE